MSDSLALIARLGMEAAMLAPGERQTLLLDAAERLAALETAYRTTQQALWDLQKAVTDAGLDHILGEPDLDEEDEEEQPDNERAKQVYPEREGVTP